jgi:hypothetical protein
MHEWKNGINWGWFMSIINSYHEKKISRERFIAEWKNAQETMESLNKGRVY